MFVEEKEMPQTHRRSILLLAVALLLLLILPACAANLPVAGQDYAADQFLVKFKPGVSSTIKAGLFTRVGAVRSSTCNGQYELVILKPGSDVNSAVALYEANDMVIWVEPNYLRKFDFYPNDPLFDQQWGLSDIHIESAWDITMGDPAVKVAVLDSGVAFMNYDANRDGMYEYLQASDLGGTSFANPWNFAEGNAYPFDDVSHGTHVTGTIAQTTNNGMGCAGVAPNTTIVPVRVGGATAAITSSNICNGIYWATYVGAKVINMSLGGPYPSDAEREACLYAHNHGVTVIASSGNDGMPYISYPAGYDESVISVGAVDPNNARVSFSNYGPSLDMLYFGVTRGDGFGLDFMAPGVGIIQQSLVEELNPKTGEYWVNPCKFSYQAKSGTSMAAPHVAGVAALLVGMGVTDPEDVKYLLRTTATHLGSDPNLYLYQSGWGLINAGAAVSAAAGGLFDQGPVANAGFDQIVIDGDENGMEGVNLDGSASTNWMGFPIIYYNWYENGALIGQGPSISINLATGVHTIALTCIDSVGKSNTATCQVLVIPSGKIVRISGVNVDYIQGSRSATVVCTVTVSDALGNPVPKATVTGRWAGVINKSVKMTTNAKGEAIFKGGVMKPGYYSFTVIGLQKSGYTYRSDLNIQNSDGQIFY
jgi:serine protease